MGNLEYNSSRPPIQVDDVTLAHMNVVIGTKLIETIEQGVACAPAVRQVEAAATTAKQWLGTIRAALDATRKPTAPAA